MLTQVYIILVVNCTIRSIRRTFDQYASNIVQYEFSH